MVRKMKEMADFRIFDIEIFSTLQVFYPSDRARRDEQKSLYNLPSKGPLKFLKGQKSSFFGFQYYLIGAHHSHPTETCYTDLESWENFGVRGRGHFS